MAEEGAGVRAVLGSSHHEISGQICLDPVPSLWLGHQARLRLTRLGLAH